MSLSPWDEGSDSDHATGLTWDLWLAGYHKIPAWQRAKLPRYRREWAVEVRPFTAEKRLLVSEAQGLSGEAVKGNPTPTVIPGVDESKPSLRAIEDLTEPSLRSLRAASSGACTSARYQASRWWITSTTLRVSWKRARMGRSFRQGGFAASSYTGSGPGLKEIVKNGEIRLGFSRVQAWETFDF